MEIRTRLDIPYAEARGGDPSDWKLDVHAPIDASGADIVIWLHGGWWTFGTKEKVGRKPEGFATGDVIFISVAYPLAPRVDYRSQAGAIAAAVSWVHEHAAELGGDPEKIFLMGHSSGAHLAALVATDEAYLARVGLTPATIRGVILSDGIGYDLLKEPALLSPNQQKFLNRLFTRDRKALAAASPAHHIERGTGTPPFLVLYIPTRASSVARAKDLETALRKVGVATTMHKAYRMNHKTLNTRIGPWGNPTLKVILEFLEGSKANPRADPIAIPLE